MNKKKVFNITKASVVLLLATILRSISIYTFTVPNRFAPGGVTGIASILYNIEGIGFNVGITILVLNIPLLILAFFKINRAFAIKSAIVVLVMSGMIELLGIIDFPQYGGEYFQVGGEYAQADMMLAALFGGALAGASLALTFRENASSGGSDILGAVIQKKFVAVNVAWFILAVDAVIIIAAGIAFSDIEPVMYSFISLFVASKVCEVISNGFTTAVTFTVITNKPEELGRVIIDRLKRGVTAVEGTGLYTGKKNTALYCVVKKRQVTEFHRILKEVDKEAFAYAMPASEVLGQGFTGKLVSTKRRDEEQ